MTKEELIGKAFDTNSSSLIYHISDYGIDNCLIEWYTKDGHSHSGKAIYTVKQINSYLKKGVWRFKDIVPQNVSNYSIF